MADWDNRIMFERYLYDYLRKNNMDQTAEFFKREANLTFDPMVPAAIDVPDGFLHEWWLVFYDMFRAWQSQDHDPGEGSSTMVEQIMETRQQADSTLPRQYEMNEQTIRHLLISTNSRLTAGGDAVGSIRWPLTEAVQIPQGFSSSSHQLEILTSTLALNMPGNLANSTGEEVGSSVHAASRTADVAVSDEICWQGADLVPPGFENYVLNSTQVTEEYQKEQRGKSQSAEIGREISDTSDSEDGNSRMPGVAASTSKASLTKYKSSDDTVKLSSSNADGKKDEGGPSSSNFPGCSTTADASIVRQVEFSKEE